MFRQHLGDLSIEEGTVAVPADGRYYVIKEGVVRQSFKTLKGAHALYVTLRATNSAAASSE